MPFLPQTQHVALAWRCLFVSLLHIAGTCVRTNRQITGRFSAATLAAEHKSSVCSPSFIFPQSIFFLIHVSEYQTTTCSLQLLLPSLLHPWSAALPSSALSPLSHAPSLTTLVSSCPTLDDPLTFYSCLQLPHSSWMECRDCYPRTLRWTLTERRRGDYIPLEYVIHRRFYVC